MHWAALVALVLAARTAGAGVDWAAGTVTARGVGPADLRAPSPDIARVSAERVALERGRAELLKTLRAIPVAGGGNLGAKAEDALAGLVEKSEPEKTLYSDGSVVLVWRLPLARVGEVALGVPAPTAPETVSLVVAAPKIKLKPALGYRVRAGATVREGPVVFLRSAADAPAAAGRIDTRATASKDGVIAIDLDEAKLAALKDLVIFVVGGDS